jgi:hypothetical protein
VVLSFSFFLRLPVVGLWEGGVILCVVCAGGRLRGLGLCVCVHVYVCERLRRSE